MMARTMTGVVTIVQESRFQMIDDAGVSHLFVLAPNAAAEPSQLAALQRAQARVQVRFSPARNVIGHLAYAISVCGG
jgi:hypothetical protein